MVKGREHVGACMIVAAHVSDNFIQTLALNIEKFPLFPCYSRVLQLFTREPLYEQSKAIYGTCETSSELLSGSGTPFSLDGSISLSHTRSPYGTFLSLLAYGCESGDCSVHFL
ncbi:hypothetical protein J6590_052764 [Homalodisca vitripennis]|nr:hypothetical protein J6590_052764 [Homalodisca vitripennis]